MELDHSQSDQSWRRNSYRNKYLLIIVILSISVTTIFLTTRFRFFPSQNFRDLDNKETGYQETNSSNIVPSGDSFGIAEDEDDPLVQSIEASPAYPEEKQQPISKVIIAAIKKGEETQLDWIPTLLPDWDAARYTYDGPTKLYLFDGPQNQTIAKNRGREANVYLTYIITYYDRLPDYMVFIHGKRYQSHNDDPMYDTMPEIRDLQLDYVAKNGYTPLRCAWHEGCPGPDNRPLLGHKDTFWEVRGLYAKTFHNFFPDSPIPSKIAAPCCAQFAVTRDDVLKIPLKKWKQMRKYIYNTHFAMESVESMKLGLVMEYMWHIIFDKPAMFCGQSAKECYCKKFGLCNLQCPKKESCKGRIWPRPSMTLPKDWPKKSQGRNGWPIEGWWNDVN